MVLQIPSIVQRKREMWGTREAAQLAGAVAVERRVAGATQELRAQITEIAGLRPQLVCPGDLVTAESGTLRGRGIIERQDGKLAATTCGVVEKVNKLVYVRPLKHKYTGSIGDVVVGRIVEVQTDRWSVEVGTANHASLHLGSIHLPGNVMRRRTDEDTLRMHEFFEANDIISAEVQKVNETGEVSLQTRTSRYGKLQNGVLAQVPAVYVRRQAQHIVTLPKIGVMVVLGNNGWLWICAPPKVAGSGRHETLNFSQMDVRYDEVQSDLRERICRVRNAILALAAHGLEVTPESISFVYHESVKRSLAAWELLDTVRCASAGLLEAVLEDAAAAGEGK